VVAADSTVIYHDIPCPESYGTPLDASQSPQLTVACLATCLLDLESWLLAVDPAGFADSCLLLFYHGGILHLDVGHGAISRVICSCEVECGGSVRQGRAG
jgi:hypothetical protein